MYAATSSYHVEKKRILTLALITICEQHFQLQWPVSILTRTETYGVFGKWLLIIESINITETDLNHFEGFKALKAL